LEEFFHPSVPVTRQMNKTAGGLGGFGMKGSD
jgi:hypothetical protein